MPAVELRQIDKRFGDLKAADSISLNIQSGEFVTLLGPSGCGKTTALRIMAGLETPDRGEVLIRDRDVTRQPSYRRNIGMVFQSHALFPHLSVRDNVAFGLKMRGVARPERYTRAELALELVRLGGLGARMPSQLSGGQQQRVAIARAIVFDPEILLLDEPFGALDRKLREALQIELRELTRKIGITAVFVTHDQEEALILSDRIAVMNAGRLEQFSSPAELYERPVSRFVADFMGVRNLIDASAIRSGDTYVAKRGALTFPIRNGVEFQDGQDFTIAIRPERITLQRRSASDRTSAAGIVRSVIYQGAQSTYSITMEGADGLELIVRSATSNVDGAPLTVGERVKVVWPAEAIRILER
ncbi:MAG: ABC transporter ATP-binding protein [Hyphomicrobiales bacterium]|nr:ABC transporter ATP-binding protein [Hyphomicrobiales bacterium]